MPSEGIRIVSRDAQIRFGLSASDVTRLTLRRRPHGQKGINLHTAIIPPMTSPTRPVNIVSPRFSSPAGVGTPSSRRGPGSRGSPAGTPYAGTPDLRSLRAQYVGTPPLPNIPPRTGTPRPSSSTEPLVFGRGSPRTAPALSELSARRPTTPAVGVGLGLEDAPPPDPTIDTESFQEDERVKILRKHLVSREERQAANYNESSGVPSRQASSSNLALEFQPDPEAFPVPYHTPGADITYVS
jgi:solute carrier family 36 (proton-coupled amino acid transporter)